MKKKNLNYIVTIILCFIFGFSIVFNIKSIRSKTNFDNYQGNFEIDNPLDLRGADEYVIPEPISDHLWSPDGTKLAYIKPPVGEWWNCEIWIADKSPNSAQLINHQLIYTGASYAGLLDWQGDWLLIMIQFEEGTPSSYYGRNEIWKIRTDGTDLTQLTFTNTNGIRTTWAYSIYANRGTANYAMFIPGTSLIYFGAHNGNGWYKSFVCNDDGTDGWYHISNPDYAFRIGLSPTGNKLLWGHATYWNNPLTIRASNIDGSGRVTIKSLPGRTTIIALADGNTMIWNQNDNVYAIDMDGTNERTVIDDAYVNWAYNYNPANGQELIFGSSRIDGNMHLFKMNVDGSDIVQLTDAGPYLDERPILSPDGQYISYLRLPYDFNKVSAPQPWPYELVVKSLIPTPIIAINSPDNDAFFDSIAPNYDVTISGEYETVWYTIDGGVTNITITELTGSIDQTEWDKIAEGAVNLRFYVNNTLGNSSYSEVTINKDTIAPIVTINSPLEYELFGMSSPSFDLSVVEPNIDSMWYSLDSGLTNVTFQSFTGIIDQIEWDKHGNGTVSIIFYVKDKADNEGSAQVTIRKEATPPLITIISPNENDLFSTIAPTFEIDIEEIDLDTTWYTLDDGVTKIIFTGLTGSIDQTEWDKYDNESIALKFYANDTYGFENFAQVMVHKDISAPIITINSPQQDEEFSSMAPAYDITVVDSQLDSMWYTIDDGLTNIPITSTVGIIDQIEWDKKEEGYVLIKFYANDTLGNTAYAEVIIIKDTIQPIITINSPNNDAFFNSIPPNYDITITGEYEAVWYTMDEGVTNVTITELTGTIDQTEWNKFGNEAVTIQFYVSDLAGNIGFSQVVVLKDIIEPSISINSPNVDVVFGHNAPSFSLSIVEPNLDLVWYTLDNGITNYGIVSLSGTIDQTEWDKFGNGTITLKFYASDLAGNEGMSQIIIHKDIAAPIITIHSPQQNEIFSSTAPAFDITVIDSQLESMWYTIDNGLTNIPIVSTVGTIDQTEWDKKGGGNIPIRFYARDTLGNIGYLEVVVIKDIITPAITINSPNEFEVFGNGAPSFSLSIIEPNLDVMWYTLDGGTTNIGIISLSGTIAQTEWNKFGNGTVTIQFYASDLAGNIGFSQITVRKDLSIPIITIISPEMKEFAGSNAPRFELSIQEPNIDTMWYTLDYGATNIYFNDFTGVINQFEWDKHGNGSVVIQFHVKDKGGNVAFSEVLVNKDVYAPIITIETPELGAQFLDYAPIFSISIQEPNIVDFWYSLDNGNTNITLNEFTGIIDQEEWDAQPNGPITIRFYARDKAGNIGVASVIVIKITTYIEPPPGIPGYNIIALIGVTLAVTLILAKRKFKK